MSLLRDMWPVVAILLAMIGLVLLMCLWWYGERDNFERYCHDVDGLVGQFDDIYVCTDADGRLLGLFK